MSNKTAIIDRFLDFGKRMYGPEYGWKKKYADALKMSPQSLEKIVQRKSIGGIVQQRLRLIGCDVEWLITGTTEKKDDVHIQPSLEDSVHFFAPHGISEKEKKKYIELAKRLKNIKPNDIEKIDQLIDLVLGKK